MYELTHSVVDIDDLTGWVDSVGLQKGKDTIMVSLVKINRLRNTLLEVHVQSIFLCSKVLDQALI